MVIYKKGDLLEAPEDIIAHGVNCMGAFGSGVAGAVAKKYPKARQYYFDKFEERGWNLGDVQFVPQWNDKIIANCATQKEYLPRGVLHANYVAIELVMKCVKDCGKAINKSIAIPKIGCGLAGGDWNIVKAILEDVFHDYDVTVYSLEE